MPSNRSPLSVRLNPEEEELLEKRAAIEHRPKANLMLHYILTGLEADEERESLKSAMLRKLEGKSK